MEHEKGVGLRALSTAYLKNSYQSGCYVTLRITLRYVTLRVTFADGRLITFGRARTKLRRPDWPPVGDHPQAISVPRGAAVMPPQLMPRFHSQLTGHCPSTTQLPQVHKIQALSHLGEPSPPGPINKRWQLSGSRAWVPCTAL